MKVPELKQKGKSKKQAKKIVIVNYIIWVLLLYCKKILSKKYVYERKRHNNCLHVFVTDKKEFETYIKRKIDGTRWMCNLKLTEYNNCN